MTTTMQVNSIFKNYARPRKELIGNRYQRTPKFNIEATRDMNGERCFVVRFKGQIVTTIPSQLTRQAARDKAAHYWRVVRNPDRLKHIEVPF